MSRQVTVRALWLQKRHISAPSWISSLRDDAKRMEKTLSYDIKIFDSLSWRRKKYSFESEIWNPSQMSSIVRKKLCLGDENKEYTVIGEALPFPDREDSPVVNEPKNMCTLLWDHSSSAEKLMVQLSPHFPPLLWHTLKPTYNVLSRLCSEFVQADAEHMKAHLPYYEKVQNSMESTMKEKLTDTLNPRHLKDMFIADMRKRDPASVRYDYPNEHHVYLGSTPNFRLVEDRYMKVSPFVFGWPLLLSDGNEHLDGTPLQMAAFRTIFSKSLLLFHSRKDLQVDHRLTKLSDEDQIEDVVLETPMFCTINYPENKLLCGGRPLVKRFNAVMETSFPENTPVDVLAVFAMENSVKSERELLQELNFLAAAADKVPAVERVFRLSEDQLSSNRIVGQLAYTIIYLALVNFKDFERKIFDCFHSHSSDLVRVACAKAAVLLERQDLVGCMIAREADGRTKAMLQKLLSVPKSC